VEIAKRTKVKKIDLDKADVAFFFGCSVNYSVKNLSVISLVRITTVALRSC